MINTDSSPMCIQNIVSKINDTSIFVVGKMIKFYVFVFKFCDYTTTQLLNWFWDI